VAEIVIGYCYAGRLTPGAMLLLDPYLPRPLGRQQASHHCPTKTHTVWSVVDAAGDPIPGVEPAWRCVPFRDDWSDHIDCVVLSATDVRLRMPSYHQSGPAICCRAWRVANGRVREENGCAGIDMRLEHWMQDELEQWCVHRFNQMFTQQWVSWYFSPLAEQFIPTTIPFHTTTTSQLVSTIDPPVPISTSPTMDLATFEPSDDDTAIVVECANQSYLDEWRAADR
jgi:hypothetical protein